jgi:hypothetical protein
MVQNDPGLHDESRGKSGEYPISKELLSGGVNINLATLWTEQMKLPDAVY